MISLSLLANDISKILITNLSWFLIRSIRTDFQNKRQGSGEGCSEIKYHCCSTKPAQWSELHRRCQKEKDSQVTSCNPFVQPLTLQSLSEGRRRLYIQPLLCSLLLSSCCAKTSVNPAISFSGLQWGKSPSFYSTCLVPRKPGSSHEQCIYI